MDEPSYLGLYESGELDERIKYLHKMLESCELCPRKCRVNRLEGKRGVCRSGKDLMISSHNPHFGEESPLVGIRGSGTIFLTNCNLLCIYCQNYEISHLRYVRKVSLARTAEMMIELQNRGCHNINFVTPTHFAPQLVKTTKLAVERELEIPLVWNCGGYENVDVIKLLDGVVDIYMPDIKYGESESTKRYSKVPAPDYFERCKEAVKEMYRQVGDLSLDEKGIARRGLLIRHLVLPNNITVSRKVLEFIANEISRNSYVNIMPQYRPEGEAHKYEELNRRPTTEEFYSIVTMAEELDLTRGLRKKHQI